MGLKQQIFPKLTLAFKGKICSSLFCACQSCRVRHGLISRGLAGWECGTGAFCSQGVSASRPVPGCPTTSSASSHLASTWGGLGQSVPRCSSEYELAFALPSGVAPQAGQLTVAVPGYMAWVGLLAGRVTWAYLPPDGGQGGHVSCRCCVKKCQEIQGSHWAIHGMKYFEMYLDTIWLVSWTSSRILMASWRSLQWSRPLKASSSAPDLTGRAQSNFSLLTFCLVPRWQLLPWAMLLPWAVLLPFEVSWCCRGTSCVSKVGTTPVSVLMYCRLNAFSKELKLSNSRPLSPLSLGLWWTREALAIQAPFLCFEQHGQILYTWDKIKPVLSWLDSHNGEFSTSSLLGSLTMPTRSHYPYRGAGLLGITAICKCLHLGVTNELIYGSCN